MSKPLLSIITVCYNSEKTIKRTIQSILNQTIIGFEFIIIDGNSSDNTKKIISSFENDFKKKKINYLWISEKDKGIYDAFNKGVRLAKGEWVSFLGSDDYYFENALELYTKEIKTFNGNVDLIHSNVNLGNRKTLNDKWSWRVFRRKMNIAHVGAFHNQEYFKKYGLFNETYKIAGDYELLLRAKQQLKTHWFNAVTAFMSDDGISNNQIIKVYKETSRAKIESKSMTRIGVIVDFYYWIFKYRIKTMLNAISR